MLVILASQFDKSANDLVARWKDHDAALLTSKDLSRRGWKYYSNQPQDSIAVVDNKQVSVKEITGVLTRLPYIYDLELSHIVASDRPYVAAEMMAFMVCWLSTLRCPVLNSPSMFCLTGPNWRHEQWVYAAAKAGIPTRPIFIKDELTSNNFKHGRYPIMQDTLSSPPPCSLSCTTITLVGDRCFGSPNDQNIVAKALSLAKMAGTDLLSLSFKYDNTSQFFFVNADLCPSIVSSADIEEAVLEYLQGIHQRLKN